MVESIVSSLKPRFWGLNITCLWVTKSTVKFHSQFDPIKPYIKSTLWRLKCQIFMGQSQLYHSSNVKFTWYFPCTHFCTHLFGLQNGSNPNFSAETGGGCRVDATRSPRAAEAARQPGAVCALVGELPQLGGWDPKKAPWHPVAMKVGWLYPLVMST